MNQKQTSTILFVLGIILALTAAFFMVFDVLPTALRIVILIVGIGLIAIFGSTRKDRKSK